jgi:hypothetical protein
MRIRDLISQLEDIAEQHEDNVVVKLAMQPSWPFEYSIGDVVEVKQTKKEKQQGEPVVCVLGEGQQLGYLSGAAARALGWSDNDDDDDECSICGGDHDGPCDGDAEAACPGCGCRPGDGVTAGCFHPDGCGHGICCTAMEADGTCREHGKGGAL